MNTPEDTQFNRAPLLLALGLSLALVIGVLAGAKIVANKVGRPPVSLGAVAAPQGDSQECRNFVSQLPKRLLQHPRAKLAEPVQPGTAAYASSDTQQITVRCGVEPPFQYSELSSPVDVDGTEWLRVTDPTPGSTLETWFSINTSPVVAMTADAVTLNDNKMPVRAVAKPLSTFARAEHPTNPVPLASLAAPAASDMQCDALMHALPDALGTAYRRVHVDTLPESSAAWTADGMEPVVLRCGVEAPANYAPGARLNQINDIPWFHDTKLANGTTAGTYYALGREVNVAVNMPQNAGNAVIVTLTEAITANTKAK
ncbi:DUF3515 domain-containing protein [Staphylococcus chromogenes]|nr:DUF3515 domain-containing protein [Staphylococcus chromogenes]